ncbi:MAG: thermosome subunit [Candidatus Altiarchaeota archaeon]|nr:thermosome subunit [Candidatus Altiarchaeota archaeon]
MGNIRQPIVVLPEGATRILGRDAQRINIMAAKAVSEIVRTTLGPKGMDKMLVDTLGDVVVTNDGVTILETMEIDHPAAKMIVEVAKAQEDEVGDGTTTAVVLAGELLKRAEDLLEQDIHPAVISHGYKIAAKKAMEIVDEIAKDISVDDIELFRQIAATSMNGRGTESGVQNLADLSVKAMKKVVEKATEGWILDVDDIKIETRAGGSLEDSEMISGIVLDKERVHANMPKTIDGAKIALLNVALEIKETETDAQIRITAPEQLEAFLQKEEDIIKKMAKTITSVGANVVVCQKGIDDLAQHFLAKSGVFAIRRVKQSDMKKIAKATGGKIITDIRDLNPKDLGFAKNVEEKKIAGEAMTFIQGCKDPKAVTLLIRGGTTHVVDEAERAIKDALKVLAVTVIEGKVVAGGGAAEVAISTRLAKYAPKVGGREQLAIEAFSKALEIIPRSLADNAGLSAIDLLVKVKSEHEKGQKFIGIEVKSGTVTDMFKLGVIEPAKVKKQAIKSASEAAIMILKIDDVIAASNLSKGAPDMGGMPGMGGMGGGF